MSTNTSVCACAPSVCVRVECVRVWISVGVDYFYKANSSSVRLLNLSLSLSLSLAFSRYEVWLDWTMWAHTTPEPAASSNQEREHEFTGTIRRAARRVYAGISVDTPSLARKTVVFCTLSIQSESLKSCFWMDSRSMTRGCTHVTRTLLSKTDVDGTGPVDKRQGRGTKRVC